MFWTFAISLMNDDINRLTVSGAKIRLIPYTRKNLQQTACFYQQKNGPALRSRS